jgi:ribosome-binding ATPase
MSLKVGIVGLPNVGKSTLFNALLKKRVALSANYPFATIEPNVGVVEVPDSRLKVLAEIIKDEEKMDSLPPLVPAVVEFVDIAGLVKGASVGEGLGNQFLSYIREVDAIIHVLRDFKDENVIRSGSVTPVDDLLTIETELALSDLQVLEKLVLAQEKQNKNSSDPLDFRKMEILQKIKETLESGKILGKYEVGEEKLQIWFTTLPLLTTKPKLMVYNVSEDEYGQRIKDLETKMKEEIEDSVIICAKLEEELADYSEEERKEYLDTLGIQETGLERLIKKAYQILGLCSFLTAGKKEIRAWTVKVGSKAPVAAGVIHTDFEKGFIRAQVIEYQKLVEAGSYVEAKKNGWVRTEGKDYIVRDGDVVEFLINS